MSLNKIWIKKKWPIIVKRNIFDLSGSYSQETGLCGLVWLQVGSDLFYVKRVSKVICLTIAHIEHWLGQREYSCQKEYQSILERQEKRELYWLKCQIFLSYWKVFRIIELSIFYTVSPAYIDHSKRPLRET